MAKRNKKMRSNRSAFKLETLEQRQLLATIAGGVGGTEVGSNITVAGKVYDQILMTGSSITVQADASQIVRVDFMDKDGDLVRAEYSGAGALTINLSDFTDAATATKYTIPGIKYVSGVASFTITGSDATSNVNIYSLGTLNAFNGLANPIFANGTTTGGSHVANVSRLVIIGDATNPVNGPGSAFGSVFAGNAVFSDSSGVTGLYAPNTSFKTGSTITLGDITPTGTATPVLSIGAFSDVKTVTIAGGSLDVLAPTSAYSGPGFLGANFGVNVSTIVSSTGTKSDGTVLPTLTIANAGAAGKVTYTSGLGAITVDGTVATTASLDALYKGSYLQDVTINGGLAAGVVFHALQFGNITINGNLAGLITTDANDNNVSNGNEQGIGNVTITGDIVDGGYIESATTIGTVSVGGKVTHALTAPLVTISGVPTANAPAVISTLGRSGSSAAIGNITFTGDVNHTSVEGLVYANIAGNASTTGIGSITGSNLTVNNGTASLAAITSKGSGQSIGSMTFSGDVSITNAGAGGGFINSARATGNVTAKSLTIATNAATGIVTASTAGSIGNISTTSGALTLTTGTISAGSSVGNFSVTGGSMTLSGAVVSATAASSTGGIGSITVEAGNLTTTAGGTLSAGNGSIGAITLKAGNATIDGNITATGGNVGAISVTNTQAQLRVGTVAATTIKAINSATTTLGGGIGNITVSSTTAGQVGDFTLGAATNGKLVGNTVGNITVNSGNLLFGATAGSSVVASNTVGDSWLNASIGNVTVTGRIVGTDANIEFQANKIGNVSVTGQVAGTDLLTNVIFSAKGTTQAAILAASIGNITLDNSAGTTGAVGAATTGSTTASTGTGFSSSRNIGNIAVTAALNGTILKDVAGSSLVFRAGSSEMLSAANTLAAGVALKTAVSTTTIDTVSIGNVNITGNLGGNVSGATTGSALVINSGADVVAAGKVATVAQNSAAAVAVGATTGSGLATGAMTSGSIGNVVVVDSSGATNRSAFNTSQLTESNVGAHANGVSVIIADNIASIQVNGGVQLLNITPTGVALKGVVNTTATSATQTFASNTSDLVVVIL